MRQALPHPGAIRSLGISADGAWIATGTTERLASIWEVQTGRKLLELPEQPTWVMGVAFAPDRRTLYTATGSWRPEDAAAGSAVSSWKIAPADAGLKATLLAQSQPRTGSLECLRISKDGRRLITSGTDGKIIVWDPIKLVPLQTIAHDTAFHRGVLLPSDKQFAAGDVAGRVSLWDLNTQKRLRLYSGHSGHIFDIAASPDGEILASASEDDTIGFWSAAARGAPPPAWTSFMEAIQNSEK
jgi:WD40 repeat protein